MLKKKNIKWAGSLLYFMFGGSGGLVTHSCLTLVQPHGL